MLQWSSAMFHYFSSHTYTSMNFVWSDISVYDQSSAWPICSSCTGVCTHVLTQACTVPWQALPSSISRYPVWQVHCTSPRTIWHFWEQPPLFWLQLPSLERGPACRTKRATGWSGVNKSTLFTEHPAHLEFIPEIHQALEQQVHFSPNNTASSQQNQSEHSRCSAWFGRHAMLPWNLFNNKKENLQGRGGCNALTHDSRDVAVHQFRLRSRWLRYTLSSARCSVRSHTGTDQEHKEGSLRGTKISI